MAGRRMLGMAFKQDGTVTILAVIILSSLLLFFGVLIDYARIAALQLQTEQAARSAVRSVLSAYDAGLYERYGLFGRGGTEGEAIYAEAMEAMMGDRPPFLQGGFRLLATRVEHTGLHVSSTLGEYDIFARQVLEEMKYKAPIDFTIELIAKFASLAMPLKESSATIVTLEQLRKMYEQRERLLEEALQLQMQAAETAAGSEAAALIPARSGGGKRVTVQSLMGGLSEYVSQVAHDAALEEGEEPLYGASIVQFEADVASLSAALRNAADGLHGGHSAALSGARGKLEQAEQINHRMRQAVEQSERAAPGGYDEVAGNAVPGSELYPASGEPADELEAIRGSGSQLIRDEEWFRSFRGGIDRQDAALDAFTSRIPPLLSLLREAMSPLRFPLLEARLAQSLAGAREAYANYESAYIRPGTVLQARKAELQEGDVKRQLEEQKSRTASLWREAGRLLGGMAGTSEQPEHRELFRKVKQRYEQNLLFNEPIGNGPNVVEESDAGDRPLLAGDAHEAAEHSSSLMDGLFGGMSDMLMQGRDFFYYGEYAASRFAYFDPRQLRSLMEDGDTGALSEAASFHNQEMEYVLYGFHDPLGNLLAAYGELFAVRLAIRTMEGLVESRSLGHPLLVLSAAIIYGLEKTIEDMISFTRKGSAPLSKYVKAELSYKDYLRLFMLLHGGRKEERLARMIAVIEQNCGITLATVPTGVSGEATVSMELWFVPGIMRLLGRFDGLQGKVVGGRYESIRTVGLSY